MALLRAKGTVVIVTSGAIALGRTPLGLHGKVLSLEEKQAAASQATLIHAYQDVIGSHGIGIAQILLTLGDSEARRRFLNASNTLDTLPSSARCRSSTKTTQARPRKSATATTTAWRRGSRRWSRPTRWCYSRSISTGPLHL